MDCLIYALYCPKLNVPVYIGKSTSGINRPMEHIDDKSHSKKVLEWINNLKKEGLIPIIAVLERTDNSDILEDKETFWIHKFIRDGNLLLNQKQITPIVFDTIPFSDPMENDYIKGISSFIRARRKLLKITQKTLSLKSGVGLRFIRDIEQNRKDNFSSKVLAKVLSVLGAQLSITTIKDNLK